VNWRIYGAEHDPEKCEAVFRIDHAQTMSQGTMIALSADIPEEEKWR
jgi:hypothetical protein